MTIPAYPAARLVAAKAHAHFVLSHSTAGQQKEDQLAPVPDEETIEAIVDAAFWTSLRREEKYPPRISIAFVAPEHASPTLQLEHPLPLNPAALTRVAPGLERPGIHLGVWSIDGELRVWGSTRNLPPLCFVVQTVAPGLTVIKQRPTDRVAKFINIAVLEGDQVKILDHKFSSLRGCPALLRSLLGIDSRSAIATDSLNLFIQLAISMRQHERGGSLLVVPRQSDAWRESISQPVSYSVHPPYSELSDVIRDDAGERNQRRWRDALLRAIDAVAGLTAIDGATVITDDYEVLAFGAKIIRPDGSDHLKKIAITEPIEGAVAEIINPGQLGGTRHISAAQFAYVQRDAIALVASQDGPFTIFNWSSSEEILYGYKVETLLL